MLSRPLSHCARVAVVPLLTALAVVLIACSSTPDPSANGSGGTAAQSGTAGRSVGGSGGDLAAGATGGTTPTAGASAVGASGGMPTAASGGASSGGSSASVGGTGGAGASGSGGLGGSGGTAGMLAAGGVSAGGASGPAAGGASPGGAGGIAGTGGVTAGSGGVGMAGRVGAAGSGGGAAGSVGAPAVRIVGRTATSANGVKFAWPGVSFTAHFTGTQASIQLNDGGNKNRFTSVVDGGTPKTFTTASGTTSYPLATGLASGEHTVLVWRNTESYGGTTEFVAINNFGTSGALLAPPAAPAHRIEIIGDSISCGAGVEGTSTSCTTDNFTNNYLAYGSIVGRTLGVDVVTIAYSGIGMYRSYAGSGQSAQPVMSDRYDFANANDNTAWDFAKYAPDAVVINLGTNDYSAGDPGQPYIDKYVAFVAHVREKYAGAKIICVIQQTSSATAIGSAVTKVKSNGDVNIESFDIHAAANGNACASHPDAAGQAAMGAALASHLKSVMAW